MSTERGQIEFRARAAQLRDYSGFNLPRKITPTDIDGFIEFNGQLFVFFELKHSGAPEMTWGQRTALERLCDSVQSEKTESVLFIAQHSHPAQEDIAAKDAVVVRVRHQGKWVTPSCRLTLLDAVQKSVALWAK